MPDGLFGPAFCRTMKSSGVTSRAGSSMRAARSSSEVKTTARPSRSKSRLSAAERLRMAPRGARLPKRATRPPTGSIDEGVVVAGEALAQGLAGHRQAVEMEQRLQLAQDRADAAGGEEILHVE